jgi:hypothetical protein|tara:strand:- start:3086 stop:3265 length:180 start_codon:yes stop_codon:yes gene_type:complete
MAITRSQLPAEIDGKLKGARTDKKWKRDPYAKLLESRLYSPKVIKSKKLYNRKRSNQLT